MENYLDSVFSTAETNYAEDTTPYAAPSIWSSLPSFADVVNKLGTAGLTRAAYEINKPLYNASAATRSPDGLMGKVGTVGVELGDGTKNLIMLVVLGVGVYLLTR